MGVWVDGRVGVEPTMTRWRGRPDSEKTGLLEYNLTTHMTPFSTQDQAFSARQLADEKAKPGRRNRRKGREGREGRKGRDRPPPSGAGGKRQLSRCDGILLSGGGGTRRRRSGRRLRVVRAIA